MKKMNKLLFLVLAILLLSCNKDGSNSQTDVLGSWNAISLNETVSYTELGKEDHFSNSINYGSYVWMLEANGNATITGNDGGSIQWYQKGGKPSDYKRFVFDNSQMKLIFSYSDSSKSPAIYEVERLSSKEMVLKGTANWLIDGKGKAVVIRTITFKRVN